jgi:hypothetical protein
METIQNTITSFDFTELDNFVKKRKFYLKDKENMISLYEGEKGINNDYKGRQLLELIQNADDAESSFVKIIIDTEKCKLQIINEGVPFSFGGFQSLMIPHLSPKRKKKYIGNKGLGFRSILNWSKKVTISSAGCVVSFSPEFAKNKYIELYPIEEERNKILEEYNYAEGTIPFPIFALPDINKADLQESQTIIEIEYYKFIEENEGVEEVQVNVEEAILKQISELRSEVLLFLNWIDTIYISINGEITEYKSDKRDEINNNITIDDQTWKIYTNKIDGIDPILPAKYKSLDVKDEESYSLKIAIQEGLKDNVNKLFSFFPTKIGLNFPMVIHGTFELDSSRNRIIESDKNKFLIEELLKLIFKINDTFFGEDANWDKLRLLNYQGSKDTILEEFGFYKAIDNKIKTNAVLPCVDGVYRPYANINFQTNEFPQLIEELEQKNQFPTLLQKIPDDLLPFLKSNFPNYISEKHYTDSILKSKAVKIAELICKTVAIELYAKWIVTLNYQFQKTGNYLSILFNDKREIITDTSTMFTPPSSKAMVNVPNHIDIDYLNKELYNCLIADFNIQDDDNKSRKLKDKLDSFVNIQSFEPAPVLTKIVTNTTKLINKSDLKQTEKNDFVLEMIRVLFDYYNLSNRAKDSQIRTNNIPILNELGEIIFANDSFLSNSYKTGKIRTELLGVLYDKNVLIAQSSDLGLGNDEAVEEFLVDFLGVNKFLQMDKLVESSKFDNQYQNFVFKFKIKPDRFRAARISASYVKNLEIIKSKLSEKIITKEQLIAWISIDSDLKEILHSNSETDLRYDLTNQNANVFSYRLSDVPSYIRYQISSLGIFEDYLLNDLGIPYLNDFEFDFKSKVIQDNHLDSTEIKEILKQLGAKTDFTNLSIEKVEKVLKNLRNNDPQGKNARKIYLAAIDHYKENHTALKNIQGLELHSTKEKKKQYLPFEEVTYVNNISLPRKILNETAVFNFPKRSGEKNVTTFFKVNTLEDINYQSGEYTVNEYSIIELNAYLKTIRPYILVHRLQKLKTDTDIKEAIRIVKSINIKLCTQLFHKYNELTNEAEKYDFVVSSEDKYTYLIQYDQSSSIDTLKDDSILSDIISEIYSISFDNANIWSEIRDIFRNKLSDTHHKVIENFGEESFLNAKSKLEITKGELDFWRIIYELKGIPERLILLEDESDFRSNIYQEFKLNKNVISQIDYDNLEFDNNSINLFLLFSKLEIALIDFNEKSGKSLSFYNYHITRLNSYISNIKEDFIITLWKSYSDKSIAEKSSFIGVISTFDTIVEEDIAERNKFEISVDYIMEINALILAKYDFTIEDNIGERTLYISQYEGNKNKIGVSENHINLLLDQDRSLLYFNIEDAILAYIKEKIIALIPNTAPVVGNSKNVSEEPENKEPIKPINELNPSGRKKKSVVASKPSRRNYGSGSYTSKYEEEKRELGKKCEEEVLKALIQKFSEENVVWLSGYSNHPNKWDGYGYDIKYRENKQSEWQFVEVKSFYLGSFYFTKIELDAAKKNPDRYYLYLVNSSGISFKLFRNLLNDNLDLDYENNYFDIEIKDYIFTKL